MSAPKPTKLAPQGRARGPCLRRSRYCRGLPRRGRATPGVGGRPSPTGATAPGQRSSTPPQGPRGRARREQGRALRVLREAAPLGGAAAWDRLASSAPFEATTAAEAILARRRAAGAPSRRRWSPAWTCPAFPTTRSPPSKPSTPRPAHDLAAALPSTADLDREMVRRGLREFVPPGVAAGGARAARLVAPGCSLRTPRGRRDEITALVVNIPPGAASPHRLDLCFGMAWIDRPDWRWIAASYAGDVAYRDARRHRELVARLVARAVAGRGIPRGFWRRPRWGSSATPAGQPVHHHHQGSVTGQHADATSSTTPRPARRRVVRRA